MVMKDHSWHDNARSCMIPDNFMIHNKTRSCIIHDKIKQDHAWNVVWWCKSCMIHIQICKTHIMYLGKVLHVSENQAWFLQKHLGQILVWFMRRSYQNFLSGTEPEFACYNRESYALYCTVHISTLPWPLIQCDPFDIAMASWLCFVGNI